jgi:serine/threonine-protein kinase HipA
MKKIDVLYAPEKGQAHNVGQLGEHRGRFYFEFAQSFLDEGFSLSPFKLPMVSGLQEFTALPGVFDDALPDGWGRLLMDRFIRQHGQVPAEFTVLDRLAWMGDHAMGALVFHPPSDLPHTHHVKGFDLGRLAHEAQEVFAGELKTVLPELLKAGGSPGGARPKVLVGVKGDEIFTGTEPYPPGHEAWMVKFFAKTDSPETGLVEAAYADMAKKAGIEFPEHRMFELKEGRFFGVKRFDRDGERRIHMHSLANLIGADFRIPSLDYQDIFKATRLLTTHQEETEKLFRLMVFNVLAHNRDDHSKNFAFLFKPAKGWVLAPGFDLTFTEGPGGEHTTTVAGEGKNPGKKELFTVGIGAGLKEAKMQALYEQVRDAVGQWATFAKGYGLKKKTISGFGLSQ